MNHILQKITDARRPNFTVAELKKAGPMFNPMHPMCQERKVALRYKVLADEVERKHNELLSHLVLAQQDVKKTSAVLYHERLSLGAMARRGYVEPQLAKERYHIKQAELAVLDAHDKLWAAQRMLQLWDFTYGPQAIGVST